MGGGKLINGKRACDWSKESGVPWNVIWNRYFMLHWDADKAIYTPVRQQKRCIVYKGKKYPSVKAFCEVYGVNESTIHNRMRRGMSLEEAITKPMKRGKPKSAKGKCEHDDCFTCPYNDCIVNE